MCLRPLFVLELYFQQILYLVYIRINTWEHNCNIRHQTQLLTACTVMSINKPTDKKYILTSTFFHCMPFLHGRSKSLKTSRLSIYCDVKSYKWHRFYRVTFWQIRAPLRRWHKVEGQFLWLISQTLNFSFSLKKQIMKQFKMLLN